MAAGSGGTGCATPPPPGTSVGMSGGMVQSAYDLLANLNPGTGALQSGSNYFVANYGGDLTVDNSDSDPDTYTYRGPGWKVYVPIVYSNNNCGTPENMNQPHTIAAYAEIVIVQVINNGWCAVQNLTPLPGYAGPGPNPWSSMCPAPNGNAATRDSNLRAIFAYYKCGTWDSPPACAPPRGCGSPGRPEPRTARWGSAPTPDRRAGTRRRGWRPPARCPRCRRSRRWSAGRWCRWSASRRECSWTRRKPYC